MDDREKSEERMRRRSRTVSWDHSVRSDEATRRNTMTDRDFLRLPSMKVSRSPGLRDSTITQFFGDDMSISRAHSLEKPRFSASRAHSDENDEDYSARLNAILHKRLSVRKGKHQKQRRSSSPVSSMVPDDASVLSDRRRSSAFTTSSGDTAINIEDAGNSQEQIFENIRLHKEVLGSVRQQPWSIRRKMKLVQQAKEYVKRHEGQLQERLAMSKSTRDILARFHIVVVKQWQHSKREIANVISQIIPWELTIKEIESQFGTVVASYFTFLRWLFWVNFVISVLLAAFVVIPEILTTNKTGTGERKTLLPEEKETSMQLMTLLNFEGVLQHSPIFYGYYSNQQSSNSSYRLPIAYFITSLVVYIYSFVATLRKMAANSRLSKLSEKDDECVFTWKMFTGWDYMIGNEETAHNRISSIILGFKEALLEEAERMKDKQNWKIVALRIFANLNMIWMLGSSVYAVIFVVGRSNEPEAESTFWRQYEITIVMTLITTFFPIAFEGLGVLESYHPRTTLRVQLARIMVLNLLNLYTMTCALFVKIDNMTKELLVIKSNISTSTMGPTTTTFFPNITTTITTIMTTAALMSSTTTTTTTTTTFLPSISSNNQQQTCHQEIIECPTTVQFDPTTLQLVTQPPRSTVSNTSPTDATTAVPNLSNFTINLNFTPSSTVSVNVTDSTPVDITLATNSINKTSTTPMDIFVTINSENVITAGNVTEIPTTTDIVDSNGTPNATEINDGDNQIFENSQENSSVGWSTNSPIDSENFTETTFHYVDSLNITANVVYYDTSSESLDDVDDKWNYYSIENSTIQSSTVEFKSTEISATELTVSSSIDESNTDFIDDTQSMENSITESIMKLDKESIFNTTDQSITQIKNESLFLTDHQTDETLSSRSRIKRTQESDTNCYRYICSKQSSGSPSIVADMPQNSQGFSEKSSVSYATTTDHDDAPREDLSLHATNLDLPTRRRLRKLCWETMFGQELVKLTIIDLVSTILSTIFVDFARAVFVRYMNRCWCWNLEKRFPQYGDFKIAENILHLVYNQGMVWMGMFFSPVLPIINVVKLIILMYVRSWAVLTCNVPHDVVFRASRSNNFYLGLLLTMLFLCVLPVGFAIVWIEPSWHCGPFSQYKKIYHIFTNSIKKAVPNVHRPMVNRMIDYIASPAIIIPLLLLLILIIYYLASLTSSLREANNDLKMQLRRERTEERRKMFQLVNSRKRGDDDDYSCMDTTLSKWRQIMPDNKLPTENSNFATAHVEKNNAENNVLDKVREKLVLMETDDQHSEKKRHNRNTQHYQNDHHHHHNVHHHRRLSRNDEPREANALRKWKKSKAFVSWRPSTESESSDQSREILPEIRLVKTTTGSNGELATTPTFTGNPPKAVMSTPSSGNAVDSDHSEVTAGSGTVDAPSELPVVKQRARLKLAHILYKEARRRRQKYVEELQNQQE